MRQSIIILALVIASVTQACARSDNLAAAKAAVQACVEDVRRQAKRPENFQFGAPPMWKNFDAYVAPDGRVFNNARLVGEMDGVYRFEKCLAEHGGFSIGGASPAASPSATNPTATCTDEELVQRPGDCWTKLSAWEKNLYALAFVDGWINNYELAERQQFDEIGEHHQLFGLLDKTDQQITYFDNLYTNPQNKTISFADAYDLALRSIKTNPRTKDFPSLIAMYRERHKPIFDGYIRGFVPPNKVIISEFSGTTPPNPLLTNGTRTISLLGLSSDMGNSQIERFMKALINIKECNTLIKLSDAYKYYTYMHNDKEREDAKQLGKSMSFPEIKVLVYYPVGGYGKQQEEFFNEKGELSGIILLEKSQSVCDEKKEGKLTKELLVGVTLGDLMLAGAKDENGYSARWLRHNAGKFINLNQYLSANSLQKRNDLANDPRMAATYFAWFYEEPTKEGVERVLTVGGAPGVGGGSTPAIPQLGPPVSGNPFESAPK